LRQLTWKEPPTSACEDLALRWPGREIGAVVQGSGCCDGFW
jgi:hypothetical protein